MTEPYAPPQSHEPVDPRVAAIQRRRRFWLRAIWLSVAGVVIPPLFGLVGTVIGMVGAFGELSETGTADPAALAGNISVALLTTLWGLAVSVIAFIVLIGVLIRFFTLPKNPTAFPTQSDKTETRSL